MGGICPLLGAWVGVACCVLGYASARHSGLGGAYSDVVMGAYQINNKIC